MEQVHKQRPDRNWSELSLVLMDNHHIHQLNLQSFKRDNPTDVISYAYPPGPPHYTWTGEIFVNIQRAIEVGPTYQGIQHELALYIAHGCNHLTGADDATKPQYDAMRKTEIHWIQQASQQNKLQTLLS